MRLSAVFLSLAGLLSAAVCAAPASPALPALGAREVEKRSDATYTGTRIVAPASAPDSTDTVTRVPPSVAAKRAFSLDLQLAVDALDPAPYALSKADFAAALVKHVAARFPAHNVFVCLRAAGAFAYDIPGPCSETTAAYLGLELAVVLFRGAGVLTKLAGEEDGWAWAGRATHTGADVVFEAWV